MMDFNNIYSVIILISVNAYLIGHSFIAEIFKRKQEIINTMTEKGDV